MSIFSDTVYFHSFGFGYKKKKNLLAHNLINAAKQSFRVFPYHWLHDCIEQKKTKTNFKWFLAVDLL